jgi:enoyl-CoA hydratase/carnithine racemase
MDVSGRVAVLTLTGADEKNLFSARMARELGAAYAACDADDEVRAVVVTGTGRIFCAGADLRPAAGSFAAPGEEFSASPVDPPPWRVRKPVIAAVNGHAIGIGCTLAMQCDIRFVAAEAKLAIPQVRFGMMGDGQSHWTVRHFASLAVAADLLLTGRTVRGEEAVRLGLASRVLPAADVLPAALATARDIADNCAPVSVAASKRLLWADAGIEEVGRLETAYHRLLMGTADATEGPRAWRERRTPVWSATVSDRWGRVLAAEAVDGIAPGQVASGSAPVGSGGGDGSAGRDGRPGGTASGAAPVGSGSGDGSR